MNRTGVAVEIRELAERLVTLEKASESILDVDAVAIYRVCEKLRRPLVMLTGTAGFHSLLLRALTLARREASALSVVQVKTDGSIDGLDDAAGTAAPILVAYLLSLLVTFIGDTLTMRLLYDIWPHLPAPASTSLGKGTK